jgi:hypothetical protein
MHQPAHPTWVPPKLAPLTPATNTRSIKTPITKPNLFFLNLNFFYVAKKKNTAYTDPVHIVRIFYNAVFTSDTGGSKYEFHV